MTRGQVLDDLERMEEILIRIGTCEDHSDQQNKYIYWIAKAIYGILTDMYRRKEFEEKLP